MTRNWTHCSRVLAVLTLAAALVVPGVVMAQAQGQNSGQGQDNQRQGADQAQPAKPSEGANLSRDVDPTQDANQAQRANQNQDANRSADQKNAEKEKPQARTLKIFELEHRQPQEIMQVLTLRSQRAPSLAGYGRGIPGGTTAGFRGAAQQNVSIAMDDQRKMLFVRGTEEQVSEIEELITALDSSEEDLEKHQFGDAHLFPVSQRSASQIQSILSQLQLPSQVIQMGKASLIVIHSSGDEDDNLKQAEEVITRLNSKTEKQSGEAQQSESSEGQDRQANEGQETNNP